MLIRACVLLLYCLIAATACASKSEVTQQSATNTQQASSPQPPGTASNTQGEQQQNLNAATPSANDATDACALITKPEIQEIQGEAVKETKSTDRSNGSFAISQCFYSLPTYNKSVSLQVTRSNNAKDQSKVREFWEHTFHKEEKKGEEAEKEKRGKGEEAEKERGRGEEGKEEEGTPPKPVNGIGDEAFWAGGRVAGALYVLKGNAFIRISIGGSGDEATKIEKLKALSRKALSRL
jgi:hypothetical protein